MRTKSRWLSNPSFRFGRFDSLPEFRHCRMAMHGSAHMGAPRGAFLIPPFMAMLTSAKSRRSNWCARLVSFKVEDLFSGQRYPGPPRTVLVNQSLPGSFFDVKEKVKSEHVYPSNQVITSKYSLITFLPRNLFEQFRRIANL